MTKTEVAQLLETSLSGQPPAADWEHFVSSRQTDPDVERIRHTLCTAARETPGLGARRALRQERQRAVWARHLAVRVSTHEATALNALTERTANRDPNSITRTADHFGATDAGALRGGMRPLQ